MWAANPPHRRRPLPRRLTTVLTGPRRLVALGVVLLVAGLVVAGTAVGGIWRSGPASVSVAAPQHRHASSTAPAPTAASAAPAVTPPPVALPVAQPVTNTTLIWLRWGDTLSALAGRYGTTVAALQQLNGLGDSTRIYAGQQFHVPARPATPATVATAVPAGADIPATRATTTGGSRFAGIYAFSGNNSPALASDPDVAGRSLVYYWGELEPHPGVYRWDLVDHDMAPWVTAGKKLILRVATAGQTSWDTTADSQHGTPAWVYAQGVRSVTEKDGAVLPQYWNPTFLQDLHQFLTAFAARYDGNPHVALVDLAVGIGGETKPDSENNPNLLTLWQHIGYTDPLWWTTVQQIITDYTQVFHHTPLALMPNKTFLGHAPGYTEQKTLTYAVAKGIWLQDNGLIPGRQLPAPWGRTPVVSEQRNPTNTDGNSLAGELRAALADQARVILVFTADLTNQADQAVIHQFATQAHGGSTGRSTGTGSTCPPTPIRTPITTLRTEAVVCPFATAITATATTPAAPPAHRGTGTTGVGRAPRSPHPARHHHNLGVTGHAARPLLRKDQNAGP